MEDAPIALENSGFLDNVPGVESFLAADDAARGASLKRQQLARHPRFGTKAACGR